ncbi:MAG: helix-turn-helix domain-containing protein [Hyphomonadaceae bacterium]|nr:helix-turn-helix domain-containing protein [Clostridia bacterium]
MNFPQMLVTLRKNAQLSQRQLAEKSGVSNTEIWRIESGERQHPSPLILKAIAPHLGVTYEHLLKKAGYIEETIEHDAYTELVFRDTDGNLREIIQKAREMHARDEEWANLAFRLTAKLSDEDLTAVKAIVQSILQKYEDK